MSYRDFNDEGPGTFEWDYVLGGNTTGLFPEETHVETVVCLSKKNMKPKDYVEIGVDAEDYYKIKEGK